MQRATRRPLGPLDALAVAGWVLLASPRLAQAHGPNALLPISGTVTGLALLLTGLILWRAARSKRPPTRSRLILRATLTFIGLLILGWMTVAPITYVLFFG